LDIPLGGGDTTTFREEPYKIGYKLIAEAYSPQEMVRQAVRAEEVGFDFVEISDHFHPWFDS